MTAYFCNNQIYRNDVNGNAQTIYYMQDGEPPEITMMGVIESGDCSFYIEDKQVVQITYRTEPVYNFYPMDDIPPTQDLYLKGFKWEGARRPVQADPTFAAEGTYAAASSRFPDHDAHRGA